MRRLRGVAKTTELKKGKTEIKPRFSESWRKLHSARKRQLCAGKILRAPLGKAERVMRFRRLRRNGQRATCRRARE